MTTAATPGAAAATDQVARLFRAYEQALVDHDVDTVVGLFDADMHRFGIDDEQAGPAELVTWWQQSGPLPAARFLSDVRVRAVTADVVVTSARFGYGTGPATGRQTQVWVLRATGWRIVEAHVSVDAGSPPPPHGSGSGTGHATAGE